MENTKNISQETQDFLKTGLKEMLVTFFTKPIDGVREIYKNCKDAKMIGGVLIGVNALIFGLLTYLSVLIHASVPFKLFISAFVFAVVFMGVVALLSFVVKKLANEDAKIEDESLTGGMVGFGLSIFAVITFLFSLMKKDLFSGMFGVGTGQFIISGIIFILILFFMINAFMQSQKSREKVSDALAFYGSVVSIVLSFWLASEIRGAF